jgi:hypothetical protein
MFLAFGGYYNQFHSSTDVQFQVIKQIAVEYKQYQKNKNELESDIKIQYKALLHGIPLAQLIHGVQMLLI